MWRTYARGAEGILFVLDSADHESFEEAKVELTQLCTHPDTKKLPILILANKQDLPNALNLNYLTNYLLTDIEPKADRNSQREIKIIGGCAVNGDGLDESLELIYDMILRKSKAKSKKR